jgi:Ser/Thr protein kinase RdoA (MazF antagonist)
VPAPALLGSFEQDGWVALLFEDVDGSAPAQPWDPAELSRVLAALTELARSLTPSPIDAPSVTERFGGAFRGWQRLADSRRAEGRTLAHADVRADNLLLTPSRVVLVDWPWACLSQPWLDLLALLPSVHMQGGPPPQAIFDDHPVARGAGQAAVTATLAALTGFFLHTGRQPAPPGLPTVRAFQLAQGRAALTWLRDRTGWP